MDWKKNRADVADEVDEYDDEYEYDGDVEHKQLPRPR